MTHIIRAEVEVRFRVPGLEDLENATLKMDIEFSYTPGYPATGPSYSSGGEPGAGAEVEFIRAELIDGDGIDPPRAQLDDWAEDWLLGDGYDAACALAEDESGPDPDAGYERMRDDREWDR
jgi:hypothetical protein